MAIRLRLPPLLVLVSLIGFVGIPSSAAPPPKLKAKWHKDIYTAHKQSVATGKPMLLVFQAEWCGYCRKLERTTLSDPRMVEYVNASFIPVHLDLERDKKIAQILEVKSVPCTLILSPQADLLGKLVGYVEVERYHQVLERARRVQFKIKQAKVTSK